MTIENAAGFVSKASANSSHKILVRLVCLAVVVASACTSRSVEPVKPASTGCSAANARSSNQVRITAGRFIYPCAKAKAGETFFFINQDKKKHTATTTPGAPQSFDATLPNRGSTYNPKLKAGTYDVYCRLHGEKMRLIVE
jgi:plastocyanin